MIPTRLLSPGHTVYFTRGDLETVRFVPWGDANVFACVACGWNVIRSGFGVLVPFDVAHDGVREVSTHYRQVHGNPDAEGGQCCG